MGGRGVDNRESYHRFSSQYLVSPRGHTEPLPDVQSGSEYTRNVELIGKMLNHHTEFQEAMNRKIHIVSKGEKISTSSMNPVMAGKVADAIRQLDQAHSQNQSFVTNQRSLKMKQIESWVKQQNKDEGI